MTKETQLEITKALFAKDRVLFFNKLTTTEKYDDSSPFAIVPTAEAYNGTILVYELKDEFKELSSKLSLPEILQLLGSNTFGKDVKAIKGWVTFLGIVTLINIIISIVSVVKVAALFNGF